MLLPELDEEAALFVVRNAVAILQLLKDMTKKPPADEDDDEEDDLPHGRRARRFRK